MKWPSERFQDGSSRQRTGILKQRYVAPDVLLGNEDFGPDADMWSFGCVAAELSLRKPLFVPNARGSSGEGALTNCVKIARKEPSAVRVLTEHANLLGTPEPDSNAFKFLRSLPNIKEFFGGNEFFGVRRRKRWQGCPPQLLDLVERTLRWSPAERLTAEQASLHPFLAASALSSRIAVRTGKNGSGSIVDGFLDAEVLTYLQGCPALAQLYEACVDSNFEPNKCISQEEGALRMKREFVGYVDANNPPQCASLNSDAKLPLIASERLSRFVIALRRGAETWLHELTRRVREAIRRERLPADFLKGNGKIFMEEDFADNAFVYASIQVLRIGEREDGWHTDGGASLLHAGLTLFGTRSLLVELDQPTKHIIELEQRPGSFYVGNLCALNHNVRHYAASEGTFSPRHGHTMYEPVQIAVMLRSDVYRQSRARKIDAIPGPGELFRIVNTETAKHLAEKPFPLPDLASVLAERGES